MILAICLTSVASAAGIEILEGTWSGERMCQVLEENIGVFHGMEAWLGYASMSNSYSHFTRNILPEDAELPTEWFPDTISGVCDICSLAYPLGLIRMYCKTEARRLQTLKSRMASVHMLIIQEIYSKKDNHNGRNGPCASEKRLDIKVIYKTGLSEHFDILISCTEIPYYGESKVKVWSKGKLRSSWLASGDEIVPRGISLETLARLFEK
jgi:hypothetical protein